MPNGQHRSLEWTKQTPVKLEKASYFLDLQVTAPNPVHLKDSLVWTMIDVICLSKEPFTPSGATKPGETHAGAPGADGKTGSYY